jgi:hypothetical protein
VSKSGRQKSVAKVSRTQWHCHKAHASNAELHQKPEQISHSLEKSSIISIHQCRFGKTNENFVNKPVAETWLGHWRRASARTGAAEAALAGACAPGESPQQASVVACCEAKGLAPEAPASNTETIRHHGAMSSCLKRFKVQYKT